jgi:hypothetical protein
MARQVDQFLRVVFQDRRKTGRLDLEATEMAVRSARHGAGAAALRQLLPFPAPRQEQHTLACPCGQAAHYQQLRSKLVLTALGAVQVSRPYYGCPSCHSGQFPAGVELDIENTESSPGVRRMPARVGQDAPFDHGREQMKVLAGLEVTAQSVERTAEAIGANIAQRQREKIQQARQLNLAVIASEPIPILYVQQERGWNRAQQKVVMGDGAEWIWNLAAEHFPETTQIVDLYHARQHLWELARRLHPHEEGKQKGWMKVHQKRRLDKGKIKKLVGVLRASQSDDPEVAEKIRREAD